MLYNGCQKTTMLTEKIFLPKISVRGFTRATARLILLIAFCGFSSAAFSATGSIAGKVVDKTTREPLAGANIIVMDTQLGAAADVNGDFIVRNIESGSYNIEISMLGYETLMKNRVVVKPGKPIFLHIELKQEPIQMSGIVVTPSFFEKTKDAVVSSRRMDFEEIITQPGGCYDVQRAVQALPAVVSGADQDNEIIVRGGNYGENLFVIDNIEIPNPNHFAWQGTGGGPINIINTDFVSTISDAFDADFSVGEVEGGIFRDIGKAGGGDAIDISGSKVSVSGTFFENVNDKILRGSTCS